MMAPGKKDTALAGGAAGKTQNGNRASFRTDAAISNSRPGGERVLQRWVPDANDGLDDSLEKPSSGGGWDQFAENERLFGLKTDYDENMYTTAINKNHPQYRERIAAADRKAREIERSVASTAHVAEERVMDYVTGSGNDAENEEDKYSGVRRQDLPPPGGQESKYMPPAKRAPSGQATVKGAPVDPAIISSQIKAPGKKQSTPTPEDTQSRAAEPSKNGVSPPTESAQPGQGSSSDSKTTETAGTAATTPDSKPVERTTTPNRNSAANSRNISPQVKEGGTPSATSTVERDVLNSFKSFASQQRENAQKVRSSKARADKEVKLTELKKFANSFKLSTPVPTDLVSIIAKDPTRQKEIQAKAIKNAEDVAKSKEEAALKEKAAAAKDAEVKQAEPAATKSSPSDTRPPRGPNATHSTPQAGSGPRHGGHRQQFPQQPYQQYRNNRGGPPHGPAQQQGGGTLAQRIRNVEHQKYSQPPSGPQHIPAQDTNRAPPTGPANTTDPNFSRRTSAVSGMGAKLNPNSHEFKPSPFAAAFNPAGQPSASSSPRSAVNHVSDTAASQAVSGGQLIRRKTKAIDVKKCFILGNIKSVAPPPGRNWDENGGLRPAYDTLPTWRQLQDDEKADSTMHLTYKEYFERQPFAGGNMATPSPGSVAPQLGPHHPLPFHMQSQMGPRQSPHMPHAQMQTPQQGPGVQPYGHDDHRMVHSSSAQSFASPRLGQASMVYPGPGQIPYAQPMYMGPGANQMGQFRSFSNSPQYMAPQQGQMGAPMMMQPHFMGGPQGMVGGPQMVYTGAHTHFMPPGGPPQGGPGANGYPSPGRPAAPMMAHQGSQQGAQPMYGMSPNVQYNQPTYGGPGQHHQHHQHQHQQPPGGPSQ